MSKSILIVDAEKAFALEVAASLRQEGHQPHIVETASDALLGLRRRRPDVAIVRAELPDASGFGLCSQMQQELGVRIPTILMSSGATAEALEEHATSSPHPADAYLRIPFAFEALGSLLRNLLASTSQAAAQATPPPIPPLPTRGAPPLLAQAAGKERLEPGDRAEAERIFASISLRAAEATPPPLDTPMRGADVHTPEGRVRLLRQEVRSREAQLARLAGLWGVLERQLSAAEDVRQGLEVELAGANRQLRAAERKAEDALHLASQRQREHGESVNQLLLERFAQEKDLIEVVAAKEREIGLLQRELSKREEERAKVGERLARMQEMEALLSQARDRILADAERMAVLEEELASFRDDRERVEAALLSEIESLRAGRLAMTPGPDTGPGTAPEATPPEPADTAEWVLRPAIAPVPTEPAPTEPPKEQEPAAQVAASQAAPPDLDVEPAAQAAPPDLDVELDVDGLLQEALKKWED